MSLRSFWKRKAAWRTADKLIRVQTTRHHLVDHWSVEYPAVTHYGGVTRETREDEKPWCEALTYAIERGGILHVSGVKMNFGNCTICDQLNYNWMKERGV